MSEMKSENEPKTAVARADMLPEMILLSEASSSTTGRMIYDPGLRLLSVEYRQGTKGDGCKVYQYAEISAAEWAECKAHERPGTWLKRNVVIPKRTTIRRPGVAWCVGCNALMFAPTSEFHGHTEPVQYAERGSGIAGDSS